MAAKSNLIRVSAALGEQTPGCGRRHRHPASAFGATRPLVGIMLALRPAVTTYGYDTRGNRATQEASGGVGHHARLRPGHRLKNYEVMRARPFCSAIQARRRIPSTTLRWTANKLPQLKDTGADGKYHRCKSCPALPTDRRTA